MKSKIAAVSVLLLLLLVSPINAAKAVGVRYHDRNLPVTALIRDGISYVPLRGFTDAIGGSTVIWNDVQKSASVRGTINAVFYLDSVRAQYHGAPQTLPGPSFAHNGQLHVPLRGLAAAMGAEISYNARSRLVQLEGGPAASHSEDDLYWLARIIHAESRGEPYSGKVAVGNVILNRVSSDRFPDNIHDVIFDRKGGVQFTPTVNGSIYNTPSEESIRAAKDVLEGKNLVPDCLYFFNPRTAVTADWIIRSCVFYTSIGNHDFYRLK